MEQALYSMFRVNLRNLVKNKLYIAKEWHIQPSEVDQFVYYEYEQMLDEINEQNKEAEKQQQEEQKRYESMQKGLPNMNNLSHNIGKQMTLPKMSIPKFN